jgi:hypothetical protein
LWEKGTPAVKAERLNAYSFLIGRVKEVIPQSEIFPKMGLRAQQAHNLARHYEKQASLTDVAADDGVAAAMAAATPTEALHASAPRAEADVTAALDDPADPPQRLQDFGKPTSLRDSERLPESAGDVGGPTGTEESIGFLPPGGSSTSAGKLPE